MGTVATRAAKIAYQMTLPLCFCMAYHKGQKGADPVPGAPHEWDLEKEKTKASLPPAKSAERLLRTHDLVTQ